MPNPLLGIVFHGIGGFAAGSFYAPLKRVRGWQWESYWLVMGLAAWLIAPWLAALLTLPNLGETLCASPWDAILWAVFYGGLWGFGNLTFGLAVRHLGMGLGYGVVLGFCMAVGTLEPPIRNGEFGELLETTSGWLTLSGVGVCLLGIALCAAAGIRREREVGDVAADADAPRRSPAWGYAIAVISGVLSACFAMGLDRGKPIADLAVAGGADDLFKNNAILVVILLGGLTTNAISCLVLNFRNRSFRDYVTGTASSQARNYL